MKKQKDKINDQKHVNKLARFYVTFSTVILSIGVIASAAVAVRQKMIHAEKEKIYSVTFNLEGDNPKGKRGDAAVGMVAGINGEKNDFDNVYPYKAIEEIEDENGDEFVRIPKFYERINYEAGKSLTYSITSAPRKGYNVAPAFIQGDEEIDYIDIGKYEASLDKNGHLTSIPGVMPAASHTLKEYREIAENDGNYLYDYRAQQAINSLFAVEFATLDSRSVMLGNTLWFYVNDYVTEDAISNKQISNLQGIFDLCDSIGNMDDKSVFLNKLIKKNRELKLTIEDMNGDYIKDVNVKIKDFEITDEDNTLSAEFEFEKPVDIEDILDKDPRYLRLSFGQYQSVSKTGMDRGKGSSSGAVLKDYEIKSVYYRGIENLWGNSATFLDGFAINKNDDNDVIFYVSYNAKNNSKIETYKEYTPEITGEHNVRINTTVEIDNGLLLFKNPFENLFYNIYPKNNYWIPTVSNNYTSDCGLFSIYSHGTENNYDYSVRLLSY